MVFLLLLPASTEVSVNENQTHKLIQLSLSESHSDWPRRPGSTAAAGPPIALNEMITVRSSAGDAATVDVSYQVMVVQSVHARSEAITMAVSPGVNPSASAITKLTQSISLAASGFSGTMTASASGCPSSGSGIQVSPKQIAGGSGTFVVVAFGQGNLSFSCSAIITDSANNTVTVPITVTIGTEAFFSA